MADTSNDTHSGEQQCSARPRTTLVVVDAQSDFSAGGALAVDGAEATYTATYLHVVGTASKYSVLTTTHDSHISPDMHFSETPDLVDTWPKHCIAGILDAEIYLGMRRATALSEQLDPVVVHIDVTREEYVAAYSGSEGTAEAGVLLAGALRASDIKGINVVGAATGHCIRATVLSGLKEGPSARILSNQVAAVDPKCGKAALAELTAMGATVV